MPLTKFIQHGNDDLLTTTYLFKYVPVKLGFIILSLIGVLRIPEEFYLYKDKDKDGEVKRLDVTIDFKLNFNSYITNICKMAARQLNVLTRIGKQFGKLNTIYHSFIMSNFSYCPLTWHFCTEQNKKIKNNNKKKYTRTCSPVYL